MGENREIVRRTKGVCVSDVGSLRKIRWRMLALRVSTY